MCENDNSDNNYDRGRASDLGARIIQQQLQFYKYAVTCSDSYIQHDNPKRLQNFIRNLCRMDRGQVALDGYFQPLRDACTSFNLEEIKHIRNQLLEDIQKNELILESHCQDNHEQNEHPTPTTVTATPAPACDSVTCV